jgi:hypothetical protein
MVRRCALWGLLQFEDAAVKPALLRVVGTWYALGNPLDPWGQEPGPYEPINGYEQLFRRVGLPPGLRKRTLATRRAWLQSFDINTWELPYPRLVFPLNDPTTALALVAMERSERDADEPIRLRARVSCPRSRDGCKVEARGVWFPLDPYEEPGTVVAKSAWNAPRKPASAEQSVLLSQDPAAPREIPAGGERTLDFSVRIEPEALPGVYVLKALPSGNPVFVRIRRSRAAEARVRALAVTDAPEVLAALGASRATWTVPSLLALFRRKLAEAEGFGFGAFLAASALSRMDERKAAEAVLPAVLDSPQFRDPYTDEVVGPQAALTRGFGPLAAPYWARIAARWEAELAAGRPERLVQVLGLPAARGSEIDHAREAVLATLPQRLPVGDRPGPAALVLRAAIDASFPERRDDVTRALAVLAERPGGLDQLFQPRGIETRPFERLLQAAAEIGPELLSRPDVGSDAKARVCRLLEQMGIESPTADPPAIADAMDAYSAAARLHDGPWRPTHRVLLAQLERYAQAHPTARQSADLAEIELRFGRYDAAVLAANEALGRTPEPQVAPGEVEHARSVALHARARARWAQGDLREAEQDLVALVGQHPGSASRWQEELERLRALPRSDGLRIRHRSVPDLGTARAWQEDRLWVTTGVNDLGAYTGGLNELFAWDLETGVEQLHAILPWPAYAIAPMGGDRVAALAAHGRVAVFDRRHKGAVWQAALPTTAAYESGALAAVEDVVLALDSTGTLHAFDPADGRSLWSRAGRLLGGEGGRLVLGIPQDRQIVRVSGVEARGGCVAWSVPLKQPAAYCAVGKGRFVWATEGGGLGVIATDSGRSLWFTRLPAASSRQPGAPGAGHKALALSALGDLVLFSINNELWGLDGASGAVRWRRPWSQRAESGRLDLSQSTSHFLLPAENGTYLVVEWSSLDEAKRREGRWDVVLVRDKDGEVLLHETSSPGAAGTPRLSGQKLLLGVRGNTEIWELRP